MARREFTQAVYAQIVHRATNAQGQIQCEGCGLVLGKRPYHIDHTIPDALQIDKRRKLTAADGKLLGKECCHDTKTREQDVPAIAQAKRREAKHLGIKRPSSSLSRPKEPRAPMSKAPLPFKAMFITKDAP